MEIAVFTVNPFQENSIVLYDDSKECAIIDPGFSDHKEREELIRFIEEQQLKPVLLLNTHCHIDHILGLQDIPKQVPVYVGPGEVEQTQFLHLFSQSTTNANLEGFGALREWTVAQRGDDPFGAIDVFGDGSLYALHVPGHTAGSMAFVARTTEGAQLIAGDGCHTAWGWEHAVEPGTFNAEPEQAAQSFTHLQHFAARHPHLRVHLGHQELPVSSHAAPHARENAVPEGQQRASVAE